MDSGFGLIRIITLHASLNFPDPSKTASAGWEAVFTP